MPNGSRSVLKFAALSRDLPEGSVADETLQCMHDLLDNGPHENTIETGCGRTTLVFAAISKRHTVFCLEGSGNLQHVIQTPNVHWQFGPSQKTLPAYSFDQPIDFALIDGPHAYPFPELEYFHIYPHLREGAVLAIDDVHIPTIHNMYQFLLAEDMFRFLKRSENTAFFRRTDSPLFDPYGDNWWNQAYNANNINRYKPWLTRLKCLVRRLVTSNKSS